MAFLLGASNPSRTTVQTAGWKSPLNAAINKANNLWKTSHCGRIEACHKNELVCAMALPELEWHVIDYVDFDGVENDIPEIIQGPGVPVLGNIEPVSTDASK